ncbi:hypothetical protein [Methyloversatilis sp.]
MSNPPSCPECERLREKVAALRDDRNIWRQMYIDLLGLVRTLIDIATRR